MLPLASDHVPSSAAELIDALRRGAQALGLTPRDIQAEAATWPRLERLSIDLTGSKLHRELWKSSPAEGDTTPLEIADFSLVGEPVFWDDAPVTVRLAAQEVRAHAAGPSTAAQLKLDSAKSGTVLVQAALADLERVVHQLAVQAAQKQGFEVRKTTLAFTQDGPRAVTFRGEVTAKVFVMSATLALTGRLSIDDQMNARLTDLALDGDAIITKLAGGFIRPHLDRLQGKTFPLLAYTAGGLQLRDIELRAGPTLEIHAKLGSATAS
jgi:hypothetical protein